MKMFFAFLLCTSTLFAQWERVDVATTASLRGLSVPSKDIVWASGSKGTVIRTIDGGKTWSVITVVGAEKLDFRGIVAFNNNIAFIMSVVPVMDDLIFVSTTIGFLIPFICR